MEFFPASMAFAYDFADGIKCFLISICSRFAAVCQKFFLLLLLGVEHIEVNQSFVHADGILPVVGRRCILAGILDAYFITFQHFFEQIVEAYRTHCLTHEIGSLHTFFHLIGNHITPVASGESHYESKVALFHTAQIDRKVFLHFQGDIILIVFGRFAIGCLADLLSGYTQWIIPTLIIKGIMGLVIAMIAYREGEEIRMMRLRTFLGAAAGIVIMIAGYTFAGCFLYGGMAAGFAQIPGLTTEGVIGLLLFYVIGFAFEKAKIPVFIKRLA